MSPIDTEMLSDQFVAFRPGHVSDLADDVGSEPNVLVMADIVEAAESLRPRATDDGWVEETTALTDADTRRFMKTSAGAARARERGYEAELRAYAAEAAWVPSQFLVGRKDVG